MTKLTRPPASPLSQDHPLVYQRNCDFWIKDWQTSGTEGYHKGPRPQSWPGPYWGPGVGTEQCKLLIVFLQKMFTLQIRSAERVERGGQMCLKNGRKMLSNLKDLTWLTLTNQLSVFEWSGRHNLRKPGQNHFWQQDAKQFVSGETIWFHFCSGLFLWQNAQATPELFLHGRDESLIQNDHDRFIF